MKNRLFMSMLMAATMAGSAYAAVFEVINTDAAGTGSLDEAISLANSSAGPHTITFNIPGPGPFVINSTGPLVVTGDNITIDATTQPGYAGIPLVQLSGSSAAGAPSGLSLSGDAVEVHGLSITGFPASGIFITGADAVVTECYLGLAPNGDADANNNGLYSTNVATITNNTISGNTTSGVNLQAPSASGTIISGNRIGTDPTGTAARPNGEVGIYFVVSDVLIGNNVVSGNNAAGILLSGADASDALIIGNKIGTDITGTAALSNGSFGILAQNQSTGTQIGTATAGEGNVISGNGGTAVYIVNSTATAQGNMIGVNIDGTAALANSGSGISVEGADASALIGGEGPGEGNVISGNGVEGIILSAGSSGTTIQGNRIGVNLAGDMALPNTQNGVLFTANAGSSNLIGGANAGARNLISGNGGNGIGLNANTAAGNTIHGNWIGLNAAGDSAIPNGIHGISTLSADLTILGNVVSGNAVGGIRSVTADAIGTIIQENIVGLDAGGGVAIPNGELGVYISSPSATIQGNIISGNAASGVLVQGPDTTGTVIIGNRIGTDATGTISRPNGFVGVWMLNAETNTQIGTATPGEGNLISGNASTAIYALNSTATIQGNMLGTTIDGNSPLSNGGSGISVEGASASALIGGEGPGEGNVISGNVSRGIVFGAGASNTTIQGNIIGLNLDADTPLPNSSHGIQAALNAGSNNLIGGSSPAARNIVSGNGLAGIRFDIGTAPGQVVQGNWIGLDGTGSAAISNGVNGIAVQSADVSIVENVISGNSASGITVAGATATDTIIQGNRIGTNSAGTAAVPNAFRGISIQENASGTLVGGVNAGEGNLISGNAIDGILVASGASNSTIQGNIIGLNLAGNAAIPNGNVGFVHAFNAGAGSLIGGSASGARNVISGNLNDGIRFDWDSAPGNTVEGNWISLDLTGESTIPNGHEGIDINAPDVTVRNNVIAGHNLEALRVWGNNATGATITGNRIGTNADGTIVLGNASTGISFRNGANSNLVGGDTLADQNLIVGNRAGIFVSDDPGTTGNQIAGNSIRNNTGIAIGIGVAGPLSESPLQAPSGVANDRQNAPYVRAIGEGDSTVEVPLHSSPNSTFRIDLYRNTACHPSGYGDAAEWIGFAALSTDSLGNGTTSFTLPVAAAVGEYFTATATSSTGSTSGISQCMPVLTDPFPTILAIERSGGAGEPSSDPVVAFDVVYTRPVRGATIADFAVDEGGTLTGSSIDSVEFPLGNALQLSTSDALVTTTGTIDLAGASFTIEFWARRDAVSTSTLTNDYPIAYGSALDAGDYLTLGWAGGRSFRFGFNGDDLDTVVEWGLGNEWEHWAATFDVATLERRVYRNGILQAGDTAAAPLQSNNFLTIGSNLLGDFSGKIDEVRVWDSALTQPEIDANLYRALEGTEAGLLALFQFETLADPLLNVASGTPSVAPGGVYTDEATVNVLTGTGAGALGLAPVATGEVVDRRRVPLLVTGSEPTETYDYTEPASTREWLLLND